MPDLGTGSRLERLYSHDQRLYLFTVELSEARLAADLTRAMKARDAVTVSVLRGVVAAVKNAKVERRGADLGPEEIVQIVRRELRKREEATEFARQAGRSDLIEQNDAERAILAGYVPAAPSPELIESAVRAIAATEAGKDVGSIMRALKEQFGTALDGKTASRVARDVLAEERGEG